MGGGCVLGGALRLGSLALGALGRVDEELERLLESSGIGRSVEVAEA